MKIVLAAESVFNKQEVQKVSKSLKYFGLSKTAPTSPGGLGFRSKFVEVYINLREGRVDLDVVPSETGDLAFLEEQAELRSLKEVPQAVGKILSSLAK